MISEPIFHLRYFHSAFISSALVHRQQFHAQHPVENVLVGGGIILHDLPLPLLVDPAARSTARHPSGSTGPAFVVGDLYIWGFTAHLLAGLFELAGWDEAWDAGRFSEIPSRFLHGRR